MEQSIFVQPVTGASNGLIADLVVEPSCRNNDASIFLLGGNPNAAEMAAEVLRGSIPTLSVAGNYCPEYGFESDPVGMSAAVASVVKANPSICFCGLGFPKQELLIKELRKRLPATWFLGVGISISFVAGEFQRAPGWAQRTGLEWLHRLTQEPTRLVRRYLVHDFPYVTRLLVSCVVKRRRTKKTTTLDCSLIGAIYQLPVNSDHLIRRRFPTSGQ